MIDWDDAFDNSGYVAGSNLLPDQWAAEAHAYRDRLSAEGRTRLDLPYGPGPREKLDIFLPEAAPAGAVIFVHGGYWHLFDKSYWSHLAKGSVARGWAVAMPSYSLAPDARISEITKATRRAAECVAEEVVRPLRLSGHSAGGHLVSRMMCEHVLPSAVADRLARIVSISGVHELLPLTATKMNETLGLTEDEARDESPALSTPLTTIPATFWVGAEERPEFLRQTRAITEGWSARGSKVAAVYEPGHHHFSVINSLADPDGALTNEVLQ